MRIQPRWVMVLVFLCFFAVPRESAAYWNWLYKLSGPGPFNGPIFWFRCPVDVDTECLGGFVDIPKPRGKDIWFNIDFSIPGVGLSGDLENRPDSSTVRWHILEAGVETSKP